MKATTRRKIIFLSSFTVYFSVLWLLWDTIAVYPLKIFVVLLHELSHAFVAVATGGTIEAIALDPNEGGACYCPGGNIFATLSAGYLGSLGWGALLIAAGQNKRIRSHWVTGIIGIIVISLTFAYVRNIFGLSFGLAFGMIILIGAVKLSVAINQKILLTLGLTSCLYAILDIKSDILDRPDAYSDAAMLGNLTGINPVFWGSLWIVLALLASAWLFHWSYRKA